MPLQFGTGDGVWLDYIGMGLASIRVFQPVVLGFDAAVHDPVATFRISIGGFGEAARRIRALNMPTLLVHEGGYLSQHLGGQPRGVPHRVRGRLNRASSLVHLPSPTAYGRRFSPVGRTRPSGRGTKPDTLLLSPQNQVK